MGEIPENYNHWLIEQEQVLVDHGELNRTPDIVERLFYGYEQHCKAVAERNKPKPFTEQFQQVMQEEMQVRDSYTASFLRSCRTVIIPSPFKVPEPLTLSYGKCQYGYLNDAMEFIHKVVMFCDGVDNSNGIEETNLGRIGTPIAIIP